MPTDPRLGKDNGLYAVVVSHDDFSLLSHLVRFINPPLIQVFALFVKDQVEPGDLLFDGCVVEPQDLKQVLLFDVLLHDALPQLRIAVGVVPLRDCQSQSSAFITVIFNDSCRVLDIKHRVECFYR